MVQTTLTVGLSYLIQLPTPHGRTYQRYLRENLEVVEDKEHKLLENIYRRYTRVRLQTYIDILHLVLNCASIGEVIAGLTKEARKMALIAFDSNEVEAFLQDSGLPGKEVK